MKEKDLQNLLRKSDKDLKSKWRGNLVYEKILKNKKTLFLGNYGALLATAAAMLIVILSYNEFNFNKKNNEISPADYEISLSIDDEYSTYEDETELETFFSYYEV